MSKMKLLFVVLIVMPYESDILFFGRQSGSGGLAYCVLKVVHAIAPSRGENVCT